jgi:riboflavin synthase
VLRLRYAKLSSENFAALRPDSYRDCEKIFCNLLFAFKAINIYFYLQIQSTHIMFTGIIEALGKVLVVVDEGGNKTFTVECSFIEELKVDQSLAHNGVCLTVTGFRPEGYIVTAIAETLRKSNLGSIRSGDLINLERCMLMNGRIDGHIVQGHVDLIGHCTAIKDENGSWLMEFTYDKSAGHVTVPQGSITINGVSLTVASSHPGKFSVAIIPYTFENTNFKTMKVGDVVNLEFDIIGKYVKAYMQ